LSHLAFFARFQNGFKFLLTPEFLKKFQNSEYEVQHVGSNEACSQNFSFLALNTTELAVPQILSKNQRQRRMTDGKKIRFKLVFSFVSKT
jgi:hypothetical protein